MRKWVRERLMRRRKKSPETEQTGRIGQERPAGAAPLIPSYDFDAPPAAREPATREERPERQERYERPDFDERPERQQRNERPERPERQQRHERPERQR